MDTYELDRRSLGLTYDLERAHREVQNGMAGHTGGFDRTNGMEDDEGRLPYELFGASTEAVQGAEAYVRSRVESDLAEFGSDQMTNVDFALDRALIAYGVKFTDTPVRLEVAVAEYLGSLAGILLDPKTNTISDSDIEALFADIAGRLKAIDSRILEDADELVAL